MKTIHQQTLKLLKESETPIKTIAARTGVSERWIYRLKSGEWKDPGVNKIERLHRYLSQEAGAH